MSDWSAAQYLKFEDERTRPPRDLLAQVPLTHPRGIVDLGCGPGNSTELIIARYPDAKVFGLDSSPDMLMQARERLAKLGRGGTIFADIATWNPADFAKETGPIDLLFGNALFQWVPNHTAVLQRLLAALRGGAVLAVQMPDNTDEPALALMREVAGRGPWAHNAAVNHAARDELPRPEAYYDLLKPLASRIDIWHTVYNHVMDGPEAIVEWFKGSALRPFLSSLDATLAGEFVAAYTAEIRQHYKPRFDGKLLLRFPRLFIVAVR
jgi:trans-aconitate 2-methyltransferase